MTDDAEALCGRLAARVGGAWKPAEAGARTMEERGLLITLHVAVDDDGAGKVRIEVRPVVGWGWYLPVVLLPLIPLRQGFLWPAAVLVAVLGGFAFRWIGRTVMRVRAEVRKSQLERAVARALAEENGG